MRIGVFLKEIGYVTFENVNTFSYEDHGIAIYTYQDGKSIVRFFPYRNMISFEAFNGNEE